LTDIITAQVTLFKPEVIFAAKHPVMNSDFLDHLREKCKSIRLIFGWVDSPFGDDEVIKGWDLVISNIPSLVDLYRASGRHSEYMCYAFEPRILEKIDLKADRAIPFSFVGSIVKGPGFHNERELLMKKLVQKTEIQIFADVSRPSPFELRALPLRKSLFELVQGMRSIPGASSVLAALPVLKNYVSAERTPDLSHYVDPEILARCRPPVFGLSMYQTLRDSKLVFNNHIDLSNQFASNMRLFEATGVGSCLVTDWKQNLRQLYEPDQEVVTYRSIEEAIEKVGYLLAHEEDRQRIAAAGQRRTLQNYTYDHRAQELDQLIKNHIRR
jgi:hypothetical protein